MMLAGGYVGVAFAVVSAIQGSKESPSPFPAIFAMLAQISEQIENLRFDVLNSISELRAETRALLGQTITLAKATEFNTRMLQQTLNDLQKSLRLMDEQIRQQIISLADLVHRAEDRQCFNWTGDRKLLPLDRKEFIRCRTQYIDRAVVDAASPLTGASQGSLATSPLFSSTTFFPFAENYETLRQEIESAKQENPNQIRNPAAWFRSSTLLAALIRENNNHLRDVHIDRSTGKSDDLDPVIESGQEIKRFIETIAVTPSSDGFRLRDDRFLSLIDKILAVQITVLNKVERQLNNVPVKADITLGTDQLPNIDHQYRMLATKGVKFCDGAALRLKAVQNVTITRSGGCCGTDEITNQAKINSAKGRVGIHAAAIPGAGWGDLRARVEGAMKGFNFGTISFDKSIIRALDPAVVLMEQTGHKAAQMSICISQFDVARLNMSHQTQTEVDLDLRAKLSLTIEGRQSNPTFLVQELAGSIKTVTPFYHLYYDSGARPENLIRGPWGKLQGQFGGFFKTVENAEADENRKQVAEEMKRFFVDQRSAVYANILSSTEAESKELAHWKSDLLALTEIGLNSNHVAVQKWLELARDPKSILSIEEMVGSVIFRGQAVDAARQSVSKRADDLRSAIVELARNSDLIPPTDAISARLNDLHRIKAVRMSVANR